LKNIEVEKLNNKYEQQIGKLNESQESLSTANIQLKDSLISYKKNLIKINESHKNLLITNIQLKDSLISFKNDIISPLEELKSFGEIVNSEYDLEMEWMDWEESIENIDNIMIIGYNKNKFMYLKQSIGSTQNFWWDKKVVYIQNFIDNKRKPIISFDSGFDDEDYSNLSIYSEAGADSVLIEIDVEKDNGYINGFPSRFTSKLNKEILSNNIYPLSGFNDYKLKLNIIEEETENEYKLIISNGDIKKVIFSGKDYLINYQFRGYYNFPGTDYIGIILLMATSFENEWDYKREIIPYKYK